MRVNPMGLSPQPIYLLKNPKSFLPRRPHLAPKSALLCFNLIGSEFSRERESESERDSSVHDLMASNSEVGGSADYETLVSTSDVELLKRAAPEILQYEGALVERAKEQIELVIEKFMFHNLKSEEAERRLSEQEKVFATKCADDLANHFEESVLLKLPENYQSILKQSLISEVDDMGNSLNLITLLNSQLIKIVIIVEQSLHSS